MTSQHSFSPRHFQVIQSSSQLTLRAQVIRLMLIMWPAIELVLSHSPAFPSIYLPFCAHELKRCYLTLCWTYTWQDHYKSLTNQRPFISITSNPTDTFSEYAILALQSRCTHVVKTMQCFIINILPTQESWSNDGIS